MGKTILLTCDEEGCTARKRLTSGTDIQSLQMEGWSEEPVIGGTRVYCPQHKAKHEKPTMPVFSGTTHPTSLFQNVLEKTISGLG